MILREKYTIPAVPAKEAERDKGVECDICKKRVTYDYPTTYDGNVEWEKHNNDFEKATTAVYSETRWNSYDSGDLDRVEFHICPVCFKEKVTPFLESLGAKPNKVESCW